jgi:hypothetical protein
MLRHYLISSALKVRGGWRSHFITLLLSLSLCLAAGCQKKAETSAPQSDQPNQQAGQSNQSTATLSEQGVGVPASALDKGDLKLRYQSRKNFKGGLAAHKKVGNDPQVLEQIINKLNDRIALPWDITVAFDDCQGPDAYYDRETRQLTICHQLVDEYYDIFSHKIKDKARLDAAVRGALDSTFFHELGHALVDAWQLPITGKEEDAVDQLSTLVLVNSSEEGEQMALDGAVLFKLYADLDKDQEKIYWDEHSLDEQRFYEIICLVYGHNPEKYADLVKNGTLPEERAELCREDFPKVERSWQQLLSRYLKQPLRADLGQSQK